VKPRLQIDNQSGVDTIQLDCGLIAVFPNHQEGMEMVRSSEGLAGVTGEWECMECGYIEEGIKERRPKRCPECDAPASALDFFPDEDDADIHRAWVDEYEDEELEEDGDQETTLHVEEDEDV
jgi:hypothetical protein